MLTYKQLTAPQFIKKSHGQFQAAMSEILPGNDKKLVDLSISEIVARRPHQSL